MSHKRKRDLMERFLEPDPSSDEDSKATITTATAPDPGPQKKKRKVTGQGAGGGRRKAIAWTEEEMYTLWLEIYKIVKPKASEIAANPVFKANGRGVPHLHMKIDSLLKPKAGGGKQK